MHFNMPLSPKSMDGAWLESRLEQFRKFTVPAMVAQSDADFTWVMTIRARYKALLKQHIYQALFRVLVLPNQV